MGLSNTSTKETVSTLQILQEIALGLKTLSDDPKALNKAIEEAYGLSESEKQKSDAAKASISTYEALVYEQKVNQGILSDMSKKLDEREVELSQKQKDITEAQKTLETQKRLLEDAKAELVVGKKQLQSDRNILEADKVKLSEDQSILKNRTKEIEAFEASLKGKAEQLKVLTEGL